MIFPRYVYAIYPYNQNGQYAGVYVGSTKDVRERIRLHLAKKKEDPQQELHDLMRQNGFEYEILDEVKGMSERDAEYKWVHHFLKFGVIQVFNIFCGGKEDYQMDRFKKGQMS